MRLPTHQNLPFEKIENMLYEGDMLRLCLYLIGLPTAENPNQTTLSNISGKLQTVCGASVNLAGC